MRILRSPGCSYSKDKGLDLHAPRSWKELTQDQLWYVFFLLSHFSTPEEVKTYMFLRFTGIQVVMKVAGGARCYIRNNGRGEKHYFDIQTWQIQSLMHQFDYIDSYDSMGVRLDSIQGYCAVDVLLKDVSFIDYLNMEGCYQKFLQTKDEKHIDQLVRYMYRDSENNAAPIQPDDTERLATFFWFGYIKAQFGRLFPHFFKPVGEAQAENVRFLDIANAQLRALTDGDITKEEQVKHTNCLRALTELNEKAREAAEFKKKYGK